MSHFPTGNQLGEESLIRKATAKDVDAILDIWLQASKLAHNFIPYDFWLDRLEDMKFVYLPNSETHVSVRGNSVRGFISLVEGSLAALFVHPTSQGRGYGKQLLEFAKQRRNTLSLCVFSQNVHAVDFYQRAGFQTRKEQIDIHSGHPELVMVWISPNKNESDQQFVKKSSNS